MLRATNPTSATRPRCQCLGRVGVVARFGQGGDLVAVLAIRGAAEEEQGARAEDERL